MKRVVLFLILAVWLWSFSLIGESQAGLAQEAEHHVYFPVIMKEARHTPLINVVRTEAGLPALNFRSDWNQGCRQHTEYMLRYRILTHIQNPEWTGYTFAGAAAAQASLLTYEESPFVSQDALMEAWLSNPFDAVSLLDPRLVESGYGQAYTASQRAACIDVTRGVNFFAPATWPLRWPASKMPLTTYFGAGEIDPRLHCLGYTGPTGAPILLLLGAGTGSPHVQSAQLLGPNGLLEACVFSENTFTHADLIMQENGRRMLDKRDAVVMLPRAPLQPGAVYTVSIVVDGQNHTWAFQVVPFENP